jgi:ACR3 family arsenite efflux pump ArsB
VDLARHHNWRSTWKFRGQRWTGATTRKIRAGFGAYRYVRERYLRVIRLQYTNDQTAVGLLVMMYPILCKVQYETLHIVFAHRQIWVQLAFSIVVNWVIAPLIMVSQSTIYICLTEY